VDLESPAIEDVEEVMPETRTDTDDENVFNLETIPDFIAGIKGPVWLRQQAADSYVLQLLSAQYMSNIKNLLSGQAGIQDQLSGYVKYTPSGKPRYLLLYGIYPDNESAEAAIDELPLEFQSIPPWPRKLGDAIKEINKRAEPPTDEDISESLLGYG
jgi:septal ring-binding cell division protein DamX